MLLLAKYKKASLSVALFFTVAPYECAVATSRLDHADVIRSRSIAVKILLHHPNELVGDGRRCGRGCLSEAVRARGSPSLGLSPLLSVPLSEQLRMASDVDEDQDEYVIFLLIDKQEIALDMAFTIAEPLACKCVVTIARRKRFARAQHFDHSFQSCFHARFEFARMSQFQV